MRVGVDGDRKHAGVGEAERLELLPVVLRVAERHVGVADQRLQVLAPERRQPEDRRRRTAAKKCAGVTL